MDMVKICVYPYFRWKSMTALIAALDLVFFVFLVLQGDQEIEEGLLAPSQSALFQFGEVHPYYIKTKMQLYRLLVPLFMHGNLLHLISSLAILIYIYSFIESLLGAWKTLFLYLMTGVGGIVFNIVLTSEPGVAGSVPLGAFVFSLSLENQILQSRHMQASFFQNS